MPTSANTRTEYTLADEDLRLVADSVPHIVWVAGRDGRTLYVNRWALEYGGSTGEVDPADDWVAAVHPDDVTDVSRAWLTASRNGAEYSIDCRLRRADGQYRWHRFRNLPLHDAEGRMVRWVATATDIHEQKELEAGLRRAQQETAHALARLEMLLSAAPVGIGFTDWDLRIVQVNATLAAMMGSEVAAELVGRPLTEVADRLWPTVGPLCRRVLSEGRPALGVEVTWVSPAAPDVVHSWLANFYPLTDDGLVIGVAMAVVDITARVEAEQFRSVVVDHMAEGLCTVDEHGTVLSVNPAAAQILGRSREELCGLPVSQAIRTLSGASEDCAVGAAVDGTQTGATTIVQPDGVTVAISYSVAPLRLGAKVGGQVIVFRDVTAEQERQRQEIESRHDQKLESLGRLSAGIAHEINTPIQFVGDNTRFLATSYQQMLDLLTVYRKCLGITGDAVEGAAPVPWEDRLRHAAEAEEEADIEYLTDEVPIAVAQSLEGIDRVASLVRAMKSFSYKDDGHPAYADINKALETTLTVARNEVKYVADVHVDLGDLPEVLCHIGDLNQVFLNLLVNAADAMRGRDGRGQVRVATRLVDGTAVVTIADDGCGIPPELHELIFEPFFTTKEVGKGTGQGLALARSVVDKHGGAISVRSAPGEGTEIVIQLPVGGRTGVRS
ncbi:PAS domain S-box protein [Pilimelia columellifera]|uniref:histidine kinase n=1 Tax=Pilimelia columellifera subsp. columellifera TaxID=706583 RepID=A0ABP6B098_9ACTN